MLSSVGPLGRHYCPPTNPYGLELYISVTGTSMTGKTTKTGFESSMFWTKRFYEPLFPPTFSLDSVKLTSASSIYFLGSLFGGHRVAEVCPGYKTVCCSATQPHTCTPRCNVETQSTNETCFWEETHTCTRRKKHNPVGI